MSRTCTVCTHDERHQINLALVTTRDPYRDIAQQFGVSKDAVMRHSRNHLPKLLVEATQALEVANADDLLAKVEELRVKAMDVLTEAEEAKDHRTMLAAIDRASKQLELLAKLMGELSDAPQINLTLSPEWLEVKTAVVLALEPYEEAQTAVARALEGVGCG